VLNIIATELNQWKSYGLCSIQILKNNFRIINIFLLNINNKKVFTMYNKRGLSEKFFNDLSNGELKEILDIVKKDDTLDMEIRSKMLILFYAYIHKLQKYQHYLV